MTKASKIFTFFLTSICFIFCIIVPGNNVYAKQLQDSTEQDGFSITVANDKNQLKPSENSRTTQNDKITLNEFTKLIVNEDANVIRGIYVSGHMALRIVQQPIGDPAFVSTLGDVATQFSLANKYGSIGLLAHNFAAGNYFFNLDKELIIDLIYGDGRVVNFKIVDIKQYQAIQPNSPTSNFKDLDNGIIITATQLFSKIYINDGYLVLQTCINKYDIDSWGRIFLIAKPL